jgi:hypothetical protein
LIDWQTTLLLNPATEIGANRIDRCAGKFVAMNGDEIEFKQQTSLVPQNF